MAAGGAIRAILPRDEGALFAVGDGARVDGLAVWLRQSGCAARGLSPDPEGSPGLADGPRLVAAPTREAVAPFERLYPHLRGLGRVQDQRGLAMNRPCALDDWLPQMVPVEVMRR